MIDPVWLFWAIINAINWLPPTWCYCGPFGG